jgi:hypothetical protein
MKALTLHCKLCPARAQVTGETLDDLLDAATCEGWTVTPTGDYCPEHAEAARVAVMAGAERQ